MKQFPIISDGFGTKLYYECDTEYNSPPFSSKFKMDELYFDTGSSDADCILRDIGDNCTNFDDRLKQHPGKCVLLQTKKYLNEDTLNDQEFQYKTLSKRCIP